MAALKVAILFLKEDTKEFLFQYGDISEQTCTVGNGKQQRGRATKTIPRFFGAAGEKLFRRYADCAEGRKNLGKVEWQS